MQFGQGWEEHDEPAMGERTMSEYHVSDAEGNKVQIISCMVENSAVLDEDGIDIIKIVHESKVIIAIAEGLITDTIESSPSPMAGMYAVGVMVGSMMNDVAQDALCEFFHTHEED